MKITPGRIAIGVAIAIAAAAAWPLLSLWSFTRGDRICRGVAISGVAVGGLTKPEALNQLRGWHRERLSHGVALSALDAKWRGTMSDLGARADTQGAVDEAFAVGRTGDIVNRLKCVLTSGGAGKRIMARFLVDPRKVDKAIGSVARHIDKPHKDASLRVVDGMLQIQPEGYGTRVNREKAQGAVKRALESGLSAVQLPVEVDRPDVTSSDAARVNSLLATYTTAFNPAKRDRTHNLVLASRSISGVILKPGQEFSANKAIGPREEGRGFRNAIIFVKGKMEQGLGGGTCQVTSTLYNAVLRAGLKVVERAHHSRTVPYVPPGLDATVSYGIVDFRFANSNPSPVGLISRIKGSRLTVDIYGSAVDKKNIRVYATAGKRVAAAPKTVVDPSLGPGARKTLEPASPGVKATVYREITGPDGTVKKEVVSHDRYAPQGAIIAVGPPVRTASAEENPAPVP